MKKKHVFLSILFVMMFFILGKVDAQAATTLKAYQYTNPYYENVADDTFSGEAKVRSIRRSSRSAEYLTDQQELAEIFREKLVDRDSTIELYYHTDEKITQEFFNDLTGQLFQEAVKHTGAGKEGDYLKWHYQGWAVGGSYSANASGGYDLHITYNVTYLSDAAQEEKVDEEVANLLAFFKLGTKTDYQKVKIIYDYMCKNISYDYTNLDDDTYTLKYSAYAALINKTAVCQGYASLFYRMVLDAGVDARVISGTAGGRHAWNIVKINGKYYNLDSTWDAGRENYSYFLKNSKEFSDHVRDEEYNSTSFTETYPMAENSYQEQPTDIFFRADGVEYEVINELEVALTDASEVSGAFTIPSYVTYNNKRYLVTEIGYRAFYKNTAVTSIIMPDTIVKIQDGQGINWVYYGAFEDCIALKSVTFSKNLTYIGKFAFSGDRALENVSLPDKLETIMDEAFGNCSNITELELPAATTYVGQCALSGTSMETFVIPKTCKNFHSLALDPNPKLTAIYVEKGQGEYCAVDGVLYTVDMSWVVCYPNGKRDKTYQLPDQVTTLQAGVIGKNQYLETLILNNRIQESGIGTAVLQRSNVAAIEVPSDNPYLKSVDGVLFSKDGKTLKLYPPNKADTVYFIPSGTINIGAEGDYPFETCKNLEELYLPASVEKISGTMWKSEKLKQVIFASESRITSLPGFIFQECTALEQICLPASVKSLSDDYYGNEFLDCENLKVLYAAAGAGIYNCEYFGCQTLSGCSNLTVYGEGSSNALSKLAEQFYISYQDISETCDQVLGITFRDTVQSVEKSKTASLHTVIYPEVKANEVLTYTSSDPSIATVDADGNVTGVNEGICYITASAQNGVYARCEIHVVGHQHSYEEVVTAPTCTEDGYTTHTCKVCGDSYIDSKVTALGHDLGAWTVSKTATCTEAGEKVRNCSRCDYSEREEIAALGHKYEEVVTAPTCTEGGYTTHTCKVCGDSYVDHEVGALGHNLGAWTVSKAATCTEAGEKVRSCSRCDYSEKEEIAASGHHYVDGSCTNCGQDDPDKKPESDDNYSLRYITVDNRIAWYYANDNGEVDRSYTNVITNGYGWWYVRNGEVDFNYTGLAQNESGWWRIVNGAVDFTCTSVVNSEYGWWFVRNGQIDFTYTGLAQNENGWWRIVNGTVDFTCTSVVNSEYGWWFVRNGQIDFNYTGLAQNENGWWRIVNGTVDFNCTSVVNSEYGWWFVRNGQIDFAYTGVAQNEFGWWRIENGALNFNFNGLAQNEYGWWYIRNGMLDFSYTGYVNWYGTAYRVQNGQVIF